MATIVNARDVILQAASPRVSPASLPSNITIPKAQVTGLGTLAGQNSVNLSTQVVGYLSSGSITGLGALAALSTVDLSSAFVVGNLAANKIGAGTLAAGVIYAGAISADQINTGSLTAITVDTSSYLRAYGSSPTIVNLGYSSFFPTVFGDSSRTAGVGVLGNASGGPGVLGRTTYSGNSGVVGWGMAAGANGVYGQSNSSTGAGVRAVNNDNGPALVVTGKMTISNSTLVTNLNADMLDGNHASAFATSGHTHSGYVSVASGRSSGDYVYVVDYSAPSNPTTRAGWVRVATNAGGGVWLPYYT